MTPWPELFTASIGFKVDSPTQINLWEEEVKHAIRALKEVSFKEFERQLICAIRWASRQDVRPRAGGSDSFVYTSADLIKWVKQYRKNSGLDVRNDQRKKLAATSGGYASIVNSWIQHYIDEGEQMKAALLIDDPCGDTKVCNALGQNRGPNDTERKAIREFCKGIRFAYWEVLESGAGCARIDTRGIGTSGRGSYEQQEEL